MVTLRVILEEFPIIRGFVLPHYGGDELGKGPTQTQIFNLGLNNLSRVVIVVALLDGQGVDIGTCIESEYTYDLNKKIFILMKELKKRGILLISVQNSHSQKI